MITDLLLDRAKWAIVKKKKNTLILQFLELSVGHTWASIVEPEVVPLRSPIEETKYIYMRQC